MAEIALTNTGLNFCSTMKERLKDQLLQELYLFCRELKLKNHFCKNDPTNKKLQQEGRWGFNTKLQNIFFCNVT